MLEIFLSHDTEKLRRGTILCLRKVLVSRQREGITISLRKVIRHFRNIFVVDRFDFLKVSGIEKFLDKESFLEFGNHSFLSFLWSSLPEKIVV